VERGILRKMERKDIRQRGHRTENHDKRKRERERERERIWLFESSGRERQVTK